MGEQADELNQLVSFFHLQGDAEPTSAPSPVEEPQSETRNEGAAAERAMDSADASADDAPAQRERQTRTVEPSIETHETSELTEDNEWSRF